MTSALTETIAATGALPATDHILEQTHLERIGPKGWLRYVFPFELPDDYDINEVSRILRAGYQAAAQRFPVMACEAVPDTKAKQAGLFKLAKIQEHADHIVVKDLRDEGAYPMAFAELKAKSFPVSAFPAATVCPRSVWPQPGERLPISLVQVNFIRGGMILSWNLFPMFGVINGVQFVFPATPDGGLEVLIGVEESCLDKLMHDPLWTKFAEAR